MERVRIAGPDDCWEWEGYRSKKTGYGQFWYLGKTAIAHRVAWILSNGPIPLGLCCLHKCDNRGCVNLVHLFLGTKLDNNKDRTIKGRSAKGEDIKHLAKLTELDVVEMRRLASEGVNYCELGRLFSVTNTTAGLVCRRQTWKHI